MDELKPKLLVVEDDIDISHLICEVIEREGYEYTQAFSGSEALLCLKTMKYDLVLLDLMLPGLNGEQVLREIRHSLMIPVIVLTAKTSKGSTINTLNMGADDYITKPFDPDELMARIQVQLRRLTYDRTEENVQILKIGELHLNKETHEVTLKGIPVNLTVKEFQILKLLMNHPKKVFSHGNIFESVWEDKFMTDTSTVKVHISKLRSKLQEIDPSTDYIATVWGVGFKMGDFTNS